MGNVLLCVLSCCSPSSSTTESENATAIILPQLENMNLDEHISFIEQRLEDISRDKPEENTSGHEVISPSAEVTSSMQSLINYGKNLVENVLKFVKNQAAKILSADTRKRHHSSVFPECDLAIYPVGIDDALNNVIELLDLKDTSPRAVVLFWLVEICGGIPLALEIVGSKLRKLGNNVSAFNETIDFLKDTVLKGGGDVSEQVVDAVYNTLEEGVYKDALLDMRIGVSSVLLLERYHLKHCN
ncbi:hypothetical protein KI387_034505 [Taxus chinensis]|uniref:Uncharacterized protein n=1 Tax=Taxus chinensis TaxID=29808 RepID=A0AA38C5R1_TAXCH|nr:hypothetical protein KI387_034505 [Taxus chinensis]